MGSTTSTWLGDLAGLFLPRRCAACDGALMPHERALCPACAMDLPLARFHDDPENPVERAFHGKAPVQCASAFLRFSKHGPTQRLLHRLKYKGDEDVGLELGRRMADDAMTARRFAAVDTVLPIPLHPAKERMRGYNQSALLVKGMLEAWPLQAPEHALVRNRRTPSQTRRGRLDRWANVGSAFEVGDPEVLRGRHVLIVDDVITTGATIEACIRVLRTVPDVRVSVLACACA